MNELKNRGTEDILLAVVDGLKGFPEAIRAVFPDAFMMADRRLADPKTFAHVRRELGIDPAATATAGFGAAD